jgi:hypothetical protein
LAIYQYNTGRCNVDDSIFSTGRAAGKGISHFLYRLGGSDRFDPHAKELVGQVIEPTLTASRSIFHVAPDFKLNLFHYRDERDPGREGYKPYAYTGTDNILWAPTNDLPATVEIKKREAITDGTNRDGTSTAKDRISLSDWIDGKGFPGKEIKPRVLDPGFMDPLNGDFRFRKDSPLAADAARYPQFTLSPEQRAALKSYLEGGWLDYQD